jgi:hypothetical protein
MADEMTSKERVEGSAGPAPERGAREERLALALRANLRRRKAGPVAAKAPRSLGDAGGEGA